MVTRSSFNPQPGRARPVFPRPMNQTRPYTFLLLEDDESDVFLMKRQLERHLSNVTLNVAATQEDYESLIQRSQPDVILSDYRLPRYSGIEALLYARKYCPMVPFVFVTGALHNEELAADTILQGASGFVLKNNLDKLWTLLPSLLDVQRKETAPLVTKPVIADLAFMPDDADRVAPEVLAQRLAGANSETLAKIQRLLNGEEA